MQETITRVFFPLLNPVFEPMNKWLSSFYMPWARVIALAFFVGTMLWVGVILKKEYVDIDRPDKRFWTDLRLWTVISMLPHIVVYIYF